MQFNGILLGLASFLSICLFHPIVIFCEYHFSFRIWPLFLLVGLGLLAGSIFVAGMIASAILGVIGFSCLWSIVELFHQKKRVEKGWFPKKPGRR